MLRIMDHSMLNFLVQDFVSPQDLIQTKAQKKLVLTGAAKFNAKPKTGLVFLEENRLIYADPSEPRPLSLAKFLKSSSRLDKRLLGDFISRPDNIEVLKAFLGLFDFKNVSYLESTSVGIANIMSEISGRRYARDAGNFPTPWRISAN